MDERIFDELRETNKILQDIRGIQMMMFWFFVIVVGAGLYLIWPLIKARLLFS